MSKYRDRTAAFDASSKSTERPPFCEDEHLEFLDELRESGVTNMFGARPYLMEEFDVLEDKQAAAILCYWMKTFGQEDR